MRRRALTTLLATLLAAPALAQGIEYAYDALGRLEVVADARGDLAVYEYDAVGNVLAIRRIDAASLPDPVAIALVSPNAGRWGARVSIFGKGFAAGIPSNQVTFNGTPALVQTASPTRLTVVVPAGATTGLVAVRATAGAAQSPDAFRVLGVLTLAPSSALVSPGGAVQFTASEGAVLWTVDGRVGGDAARGTITPGGLFVAPSVARTATVEATRAGDPGDRAAAIVSVIPPRALTLASAPVAAAPPISPLRIERTLVTALGVALAPSPARVASSAPLTAARAPYVTAVTPVEAVRGTSLPLSLSGAGFADVTAVEMRRNDAPDPSVLLAVASAAADGTTLSVTLTIAADAPVGPRVVRVVTAGGASPRAAVGGNVFTVR